MKRQFVHISLLFALLFGICLMANASNDNKSDDSQQTDTTLHKIDEVVVTGTRNATDVRHLPMTITTLGRETLTQQERQNILPTLTEQVPNLLSTQRGMMGYGVSNGAAGGIMLRGLSSATGQVMILIDGHPQYQGVFGHSISDSYQTLIAEKVEVLRGPASLLYGSNAMGGVINIVTRKIDNRQQTTDFGQETNVNVGAGSWGTVQAEASNQLRVGRFSSTVVLQYGRSDNHRPNMGFEQYGGFAKLNFDITRNWNIYADVDLTHFAASCPGPESSPWLEADQWITRGAVSVGVENHYDRTSGRVSFYDNFGSHKINDGYEPLNKNKNTPQTDFFRSKDAVMGVSWFQCIRFFEGNETTFGFDYQNVYGHAWYENRETGETVTTTRRLKQSADERTHELAGYVDFRQNITSWLTLDAGVRYDHHSVAGGVWIPQGGLVFRPMQEGEIRAMVSKGFRNPTTKEMYLYGSANHDSLQAESMVNYELSWKHHILDGRLHYGVNLFYTDGKNIIEQPTGSKVLINSGEFKNYGAELEASYHINEHWSVTTNHSYMHMDTPLAGVPTYKGYAGGTMHYGKWTANMGLLQLAGLYLDTNGTKEQATLLNATLSYQLLKSLRLYVKGDNLLAQNYEYITGYPMPRATFMAGFNLRF